MQQQSHFESPEEALQVVIAACGGARVVGSKLWPDKAPDAARNQLLACLNESRAERLNPTQVLAIIRMGRAKGCHVAMEYFAAEGGYQAPLPIEPEHEKELLQRDFIAAVDRLAQIERKLTQVGVSPLRAVK